MVRKTAAAHRHPEPATTEELISRWFANYFKRRKPLAPITIASIASKIEWIEGIRPRAVAGLHKKAGSPPTGKHARLLHKHLPSTIVHYANMAHAEDLTTGEPEASPIGLLWLI